MNHNDYLHNADGATVLIPDYYATASSLGSITTIEGEPDRTPAKHPIGFVPEQPNEQRSQTT